MKWLCIALLYSLLLGINRLKAQSISGLVRSENHQALEGVSVAIQGTHLGCITNHQGHFYIDNLPEGLHKIEFHCLGYEPKECELHLRKDSLHQLTFSLKETYQNIQEVVVRAKSRSQRLREAVYKPEVISIRQLRTASTPVVDLISKTSGIRVRANGGLGSRVNISLNGIGGKGVQTFVDGIPAHLLGEAFQLTNLPPAVIDQVAIYKGLVPVEFSSDSPGGVISVTTQQDKKNYLDLSLTTGSWGTKMASLAGQVKLDTAGQHALRTTNYFSYSDNDYTVYDVDVVVDDLGNTELGTSPRFNDQYQSWLTSLAYQFKGGTWADNFQLVTTFSQTDKEIQHGLTAETPWGETRSEAEQLGLTTVWEKSFSDQLEASLILGGSKQKESFIDTASRVYYWGPSSAPKQNKGEVGYFENGRTPVLNIANLFAKSGLTYKINPINRLKLFNLVSSQTITAKDEAVAKNNKEVNLVPQKFVKSVSSVALESQMLDSKLVNVLSAKHYGTQTQGEFLKTDNSLDTIIRNSQSEFGYGNVLSYEFLPDWKVFAGFEYLFRLPERIELFGDGLVVGSNLRLKPENSHNINLGLSVYKPQYNVLVKGFYRYVRNQIFLSALGIGIIPAYLNLHATQVLGGELDFRLSPVENLRLFGNVTAQQLTLQEVDEFGKISPQYIGQKLPNTPTLFANMGVSYTLPNLFVADDGLVLSYDNSYVKAFFLGWENEGLADTKATIPMQFVQNASLTYSLQKGRYSLSLTTTNLANALAYDNFKVQKPGRSFFLKFRFHL